jgi:hypothetical protein
MSTNTATKNNFGTGPILYLSWLLSSDMYLRIKNRAELWLLKTKTLSNTTSTLPHQMDLKHRMHIALSLHSLEESLVVAQLALREIYLLT